MEIIKANETHIPEILEIYAKARKFMKDNGNPTQWEEGGWGICLYHWRGSYISRNLSGGMAQ